MLLQHLSGVRRLKRAEKFFVALYFFLNSAIFHFRFQYSLEPVTLVLCIFKKLYRVLKVLNISLKDLTALMHFRFFSISMSLQKASSEFPTRAFFISSLTVERLGLMLTSQPSRRLIIWNQSQPALWAFKSKNLQFHTTPFFLSNLL